MPSPRGSIRNHRPGEAAESTPLWRRLLWMASIWGMSVAALGVVAWLLRLWISP